MDAKTYSGKHSIFVPLHNPIARDSRHAGTGTEYTDPYCSRSFVVKDVFIHKEEAEVAGGFQATIIAGAPGHVLNILTHTANTD